MQIQSSQLHQNVTAFSKEQPLICEVAKVFILISFTDRDSKSHVGSNDLIEVVFSTERYTVLLHAPPGV